MSQRMMNDENFKVMVAACKECGKEFEMRIPIRIYEAMVAAAEENVIGHRRNYGVNGRTGLLFGRYRGTFFIPLFLPGNPDKGATDHDYVLKARTGSAFSQMKRNASSQSKYFLRLIAVPSAAPGCLHLWLA